MLVLNLDTGKESIFDDNTVPEYALAYAAAFDEGILGDFWDIDKEALYSALPFVRSHRLGKDILYLGEYGTVLK